MREQLCYVFAKSPTGNSPQVTELATTFLQRQARGGLPTSDQVCATLEGEGDMPAEYQFFLRFKYRALRDVATTVLKGRKHFTWHLSNTLTMLEYPLYDEDDDTILRASALAHANTAGIILLRSKLGRGVAISDKHAVLSCCDTRNITCVDVLGPYDFVVEFPASGMAEVNAMLARLEDGLAGSIDKAVPLFCRVFHGVAVARTGPADNPTVLLGSPTRRVNAGNAASGILTSGNQANPSLIPALHWGWLNELTVWALWTALVVSVVRRRK